MVTNTMSTMQELIAKVGKGEKGAKDLTYDEAKEAIRLLLEGVATPAQVGSFLVVMRIKSESVSELAAFTAVTREYAPPLPVPPDLGLVDIPTYAGKQDSWHVLLPAAIVAAAAGVPILLHGYDDVPGRLATATVAARLGIPTDLDPKQTADYLEKHGLVYLDVGLYHPLVFRFLELRKELGVRSFFQPVSRMLNPGRAQASIIGMSHPPYFEKIAEALRMLGTPRALVVRGLEGEPELSASSVTKAIELRDDRITPFTLQPKDFGMMFERIEDLASPGVAGEAGLIAKILGNEVKGYQRDWVLMNAAMILYAGSKAPSLRAALPIAQETLASGAAKKKLGELTQA
jgi:anthranilate phosphoribosyltransferase